MTIMSVRPESLRKIGYLALALGLAGLFPGFLLAEEMTMTTYYPAPYGGYNSILTTGNTFLARDGGNVGIGTNSPSTKLHVNGNTQINGNATVANDIRGGRVYSNNLPVVNSIVCNGGLSCTISASGQLVVSMNAQPQNPNNPTPPPATPPSTPGCVPNGSCNAAEPRCGQTTYGTDNCNNLCRKEGQPCCVSNGSCSAPDPACEKTTTGTDNCGTPCSKTGVKCSCWGVCSPEQCFEASRGCQIECGPVAFGNLIHRGLCMTACNLRYPQCPRF